MATKLNQKELATNAETLLHIQKVQYFIQMIVTELLKRGQNHDNSKLNHPEVECFTEWTPKLAACKFTEDGKVSDEYKEMLANLKPALEHHYAKNRHHPEHFPNGVKDMNLVDLLEMICDWKAASLRQNDGNILKSSESATERFGISEELAQILKNTVEYFDMNKD